MKLTTFRPFSIVLASFVLFAPAALARRGVTPDFTKDGLPNIQSTASLVIDLATGKVLYEKDADTVRPVASLSKMVSALVIHEQCKLDWDALHEMSAANRDAAKGGDKTRLTTGWQFSHKDLLYAALMRSDNRALPALGEACGLDPATLGERMTQLAKKLGLEKTTFREPTGLSPENVSTAREMMTLLKEVIKIPELAAIMATQEREITGYKNGKPRKVKIRNTDRMLGRGIAEILGGKTGYTDLARYCLAIAARTPDRRELGMVFLGAEGRHTRFADFTRVVKWAAKSEEPQLQIAEGVVARAKRGAQAAAAAAVKTLVPEANAAPTPPAGASGGAVAEPAKDYTW